MHAASRFSPPDQAQMHDFGSLLDKKGAHVKCAPTLTQWLMRRSAADLGFAYAPSTGLKVFQNGHTMGSESSAFKVSGFSIFLGMATSYTKLSNHSSVHTK